MLNFVKKALMSSLVRTETQGREIDPSDFYRACAERNLPAIVKAIRSANDAANALDRRGYPTEPWCGSTACITRFTSYVRSQLRPAIAAVRVRKLNRDITADLKVITLDLDRYFDLKLDALGASMSKATDDWAADMSARLSQRVADMSDEWKASIDGRIRNIGDQLAGLEELEPITDPAELDEALKPALEAAQAQEAS